MTASDILHEIDKLWPAENFNQKFVEKRFLVISGGEPFLQVNQWLIDTLHIGGWNISIETNGTIYPKFLTDKVWICCSPKKGSKLEISNANEIKLVYPGGWDESELSLIEKQIKADHYYLQPCDNTGKGVPVDNIKKCIDIIMRNPKWKLSMQTHKIADIR